MIFVSGAEGFIGTAVCARLAGAGQAVRAAVRDTGGAQRAQRQRGCEYVATGDIGVQAQWPRLLDGVECVVHLAARAHVAPAPDALAEIRRINVEATLRLAHAAAANGVRRFVFLSSVKVNGESTAIRPFTETDPPQPEDAYAAAKLEAEQALAALARETGIEVVVLRPPLVYGPGVKANFLALMRAIDRSLPLPLAAIDNRRSLVYLDNLVEAIALCVSHTAAAGRTYLVSDGEDASTPQLVRLLAAALGRRARLFPLPVALLRLAGRIAGRAEMVARLTHSLQIDSSRIRAELGWRPGVSLARGVAETARWYRGLTG